MTEKQSINFILLFLIGIIATLQVILLNSYSTSGDKQTRLINDLKQIQSDNNRYTQIIASYSAIATIHQRAEFLGLKPVKSSLSLSQSLPVAYSLPSSL